MTAVIFSLPAPGQSPSFLLPHLVWDFLKIFIMAGAALDVWSHPALSARYLSQPLKLQRHMLQRGASTLLVAVFSCQKVSSKAHRSEQLGRGNVMLSYLLRDLRPHLH